MFDMNTSSVSRRGQPEGGSAGGAGGGGGGGCFGGGRDVDLFPTERGARRGRSKSLDEGGDEEVRSGVEKMHRFFMPWATAHGAPGPGLLSFIYLSMGAGFLHIPHPTPRNHLTAP